MRGTVRAVSGDRIRVDLGAIEWLPQPVAPWTDIAIGFDVPGVGLVAVEAKFWLTHEHLCRLTIEAGDRAAARTACSECMRVAADEMTTCGPRLATIEATP